MRVAGLTVCCEDGDISREIQEFDGTPEGRVARRLEIETEKQRLLTGLDYKKLIGPEKRRFDNVTFGSMALYLVNRGLEDRRQQAERQGEVANNTVNGMVEDGCVWLTLVTTEFLTIKSAQNRGERIIDREYIDGNADPVFQAIMSSEVEALRYVETFNGEDAIIYEFVPRIQHDEQPGFRAVAGS